jgi:Ca-activated chloride channel family protein
MKQRSGDKQAMRGERHGDGKKIWMRLGPQLAIVTGLALAALGWLTYQAEEPITLWLAPDQRARLAYEDKEFSAAIDLFEDPMWKGTAGYAAGRYLEAADAFARVPGAVGWFNRGDALIKGREYVQAIPSFEQAVAEDPDWVEAAENLDLARYLVEYLEQTREASGTESEGSMDELGADDYKFDKSADSGTEMQIDQNSVVEALSAEKWMRTVDTETGDFLRSRFELEVADREATPVEDQP